MSASPSTRSRRAGLAKALLAAILALGATLALATSASASPGTLVGEPSLQPSSLSLMPEADPLETGTWGSPARIDDAPQGNAVTAISCPSTSVCVAGDDHGDIMATTDGGSTWSARSAVSSAGITAISCPTTSFCAAVDAEGSSWTSTDPTSGAAATWEQAQTGAVGLRSVSCASEALCVAGGYDHNAGAGINEGVTATWNGSSWGPLVVVAPYAPVAAISCPSASLCLAVAGGPSPPHDANSISTSTDGGATWSAPVEVDGEEAAGADITGLSCASEALCVAVDDQGQALAYSAGTWSGPALVDGSAPLTAVSCAPVSSACVAVDGDGAVLSTGDGGSTWSAPASVGARGAGEAVSCPSSSWCVLGDGAGDVLIDSGGIWGSPDYIDPVGAALAGVSCTDSLCLAVEAGTRALASTDADSSWSSPAATGAPGNLTGVSCPSIALCVASAQEGAILTTGDPEDGAAATWEASEADSAKGADLVGVSCPSATLCVAVEAEGQAVASEDPAAGATATWTLSLADPNGGVTAVSCPSSHLCVAVSEGGEAWTTTSPGTASAWVQDAALAGEALLGISCPSEGLCVAVGNGGEVWTTTDPAAGASAHWADAHLSDTGRLTAISCPSTSLCVAVGDEGEALLSTDPAAGTAGAWSAATDIDGDVRLTAVSCSTDYSCVAVDAEGNAVAYSAVVPPAPISAPVVSGTPAVGQSLSTTTGSFSGTGLSYSYQWEDCGAEGAGCAAIAGAMSASHVVTDADVGHELVAEVTATNGGGEASASSAPTGVVPSPASPSPSPSPAPTGGGSPPPTSTPPGSAPVAPRLRRPVLLTRLTLRGLARLHLVVVVNAGRWGGAAPLRWAYQWQRKVGGRWVSIARATRPALRLTGTDGEVRVVVTVTGPGGSTQRASWALRMRRR